MTAIGLNYPQYQFQQTESKEGASSAAAAAASSTDGTAAASAVAVAIANAGGESQTASKPSQDNNLMSNYQQLDKAAAPPQQMQQPQQQQGQNPIMQLLQMFMQFMTKMMEMLGIKPGQQQGNQQQPAGKTQPQQAMHPQAFPAPQNQIQYNNTPQNFPAQQYKPQLGTPAQNNIASTPGNHPIPVSTGNQNSNKSSSAAAAAAAAAPFSSPASPVQNTNSTKGGATASASAYAEAKAGVESIPQDIKDQIPAKELQEAQKRNINFAETDKNGDAKFVIAKGKDGKYHIYEQKTMMKNSKFGERSIPGQYKAICRTKGGSNNLMVHDRSKLKPETWATASASAASSGTNQSQPAQNNTNPMSSAAAGAKPVILDKGYMTMSPLVLDTNGDGKVSAEAGKGIDLNGDGKADGAATKGDKMLTLGDLNKDGKISGEEVFGDKTVDPFTGQALNAKNGFEALQKVAESAEKHTGIKCTEEYTDENGQKQTRVNTQKLKQALEQSGKGTLGMVSGNDNKFENLGNVKSINVSGYEDKTGQFAGQDVQHNQQGSYTTLDNQERKVNDVWFTI
jgi:hypothetical protein